jgi:hypothetical protein
MFALMVTRYRAAPWVSLPRLLRMAFHSQPAAFCTNFLSESPATRALEADRSEVSANIQFARNSLTPPKFSRTSLAPYWAGHRNQRDVLGIVAVAFWMVGRALALVPALAGILALELKWTEYSGSALSWAVYASGNGWRAILVTSLERFACSCKRAQSCRPTRVIDPYLCYTSTCDAMIPSRNDTPAIHNPSCPTLSIRCAPTRDRRWAERRIRTDRQSRTCVSAEVLAELKTPRYIRSAWQSSTAPVVDARVSILRCNGSGAAQLATALPQRWFPRHRRLPSETTRQMDDGWSTASSRGKRLYLPCRNRRGLERTQALVAHEGARFHLRFVFARSEGHHPLHPPRWGVSRRPAGRHADPRKLQPRHALHPKRNHIASKRLSTLIYTLRWFYKCRSKIFGLLVDHRPYGNLKRGAAMCPRGALYSVTERPCRLW